MRLLDGLSAEDLQLSDEARRIFGVSGPSQVKATDNVFILDRVFLLPAWIDSSTPDNTQLLPMSIGRVYFEPRHCFQKS